MEKEKFKNWINYHVFGLTSPSKDLFKTGAKHGQDRLNRSIIILSLTILLIWIWLLLFSAGIEIDNLNATIAEQTRKLAELQKVGG